MDKISISQNKHPASASQSPRDPKDFWEVRCIVDDVLDLASLTETQMVEAFLERVHECASMRLMLAAALAAVRDRNEHIAKLQRQLSDLRDELEGPQ
jgi:hypothetical protein